MFQSEILRRDAFKLQVALWKIPWINQFDKFGVNEDIDTWTAPEDVIAGGGDYLWFPTWDAEQLEILSSDPNDTALWTGARKVTIYWLLDANFDEVEPIQIELNWTTPVSLWTWLFKRANRITVDNAWSGGVNAWIITLRHVTTTANIFATIPIWKNQTQIMAFTVPNWKVIAIDRWNINMWRKNWLPWSAEATIRLREFWGVFRSIRDVFITDSQNYTFENNWYMVFPWKSDVKVRVENVSDNDTYVSSEANWYIIDPELYQNINIA